MKRVCISAAFINDRLDRGLDCGTEQPGPKGCGKVWLDLDDATAADLVDDAAYQGWHTDADLGTRNAAQAAFRDCIRHGLEYRQGTRQRGSRVIPADAC